jgi:5-methylcytosine-specific restriction endonuclease McrA
MIKICPQCNCSFYARKNKRIYCSNKCATDSLRKSRKFGICLFCGKEFVCKRYTDIGRYCSHRCQVDHLQQQRLERLAEKKEEQKQRRVVAKKQKDLEQMKDMFSDFIKRLKTCNECGALFFADNLRSTYCSQRCKNKALNRSHDRRLNKCKKREYSITLKKLYKKYDGVCQGCGYKMTFDIDPNDDLYPSIDHIIPISKGGNHSWDNVQLMCRRCNYMKSDKLER